MKREGYISWDEYFMGISKLSGMRSKDPNTQVGACIVNKDKRVVGLGYNGFPMGCDDELFPWQRDGQYLQTKYPFVVHAELNCILNSIMSAKGSAMYCTLFPCNECAKALIQSGVQRIVYLWDKHHDDDAYKASRKLLSMAGIITEQIEESAVSGFIRLKNLSPYL